MPHCRRQDCCSNSDLAGNGHERDFLNDPQTFIVDFYNPQIFPVRCLPHRVSAAALCARLPEADDSTGWAHAQGDHHAKKAIACPVYIRRESDDRYMELLQKHLADSFQVGSMPFHRSFLSPELCSPDSWHELQKFSPDFVLYNAGTDCMDGDPLGGMRISPEGSRPLL